MQRFFERHARAGLWAISGALLLIVLIVIARHGVLGDVSRDWVQSAETALGGFVRANADAIEYISKLVGAIITLVTAIFGIVKGIHYSERRLPDRLADWMNREVNRVEGHAAKIVAAMASPSASPRLGDPLFFIGPLDGVLGQLGAPSAMGTPRTHNEVVQDIEQSIQLAETRLDRLRAVRANAYLVRGAATTARASYDRISDMERNLGHDAAECDFGEAVHHGSTACHALELRGQLRLRRGNLTGALEDFSEIVERAPSDDWLCRARAQRLAAFVRVKQSKNGTVAIRLTEAQQALNAAWNSFEDTSTPNLEQRGELARNRIAYHDLQVLQGKSISLRRTTLERGRERLALANGQFADTQLLHEIDRRLDALPTAEG